MPCSLHVAWDEKLAAYDFGPSHPLAPIRVELTIALARALGVLSQAMANEPELPWGEGRFTPAFPKLMQLLVAIYPPE